MTTHQTRTGFGRSANENRDGLLRLALKLDAVASGALGVLILLAAGTMVGDGRPFVFLLGTPLALLVPAGLFLVAYAAFVWTVGTRGRTNRTAAWSVVAVNVLWVLASVALLVAGWFPLTALGVAFVLAQAAAVALFAALQLLGLQRNQPEMLG
jgi:hypothetical protein